MWLFKEENIFNFRKNRRKLKKIMALFINDLLVNNNWVISE